MMLALMLIIACLLMAAAVVTAIAIGAAQEMDGGCGPETVWCGPVLVVAISVLMILQALAWLIIGSIYGGVW